MNEQPAAEPADVAERRAYQITKGAHVEVVYDNRHGARVINALTRRLRRGKAKQKARKR